MINNISINQSKETKMKTFTEFLNIAPTQLTEAAGKFYLKGFILFEISKDGRYFVENIDARIISETSKFSIEINYDGTLEWDSDTKLLLANPTALKESHEVVTRFVPVLKEVMTAKNQKLFETAVKKLEKLTGHSYDVSESTKYGTTMVRLEF